VSYNHLNLKPNNSDRSVVKRYYVMKLCSVIHSLFKFMQIYIVLSHSVWKLQICCMISGPGSVLFSGLGVVWMSLEFCTDLLYARYTWKCWGF